jgi:hypothetical protein
MGIVAFHEALGEAVGLPFGEKEDCYAHAD